MLAASDDRADDIRKNEVRRQMAEAFEEVCDGAEEPTSKEVKRALVAGGPYLSTWLMHCPRCRLTLLPHETTGDARYNERLHSACKTQVGIGTARRLHASAAPARTESELASVRRSKTLFLLACLGLLLVLLGLLMDEAIGDIQTYGAIDESQGTVRAST
jgi:hypothetical protein